MARRVIGVERQLPSAGVVFTQELRRKKIDLLSPHVVSHRPISNFLSVFAEGGVVVVLQTGVPYVVGVFHPKASHLVVSPRRSSRPAVPLVLPRLLVSGLYFVRYFFPLAPYAPNNS